MRLASIHALPTQRPLVFYLILSSQATSQDLSVSNANALEIEFEVEFEAEAAAIPYIVCSEKSASTKKTA